MATYQQRGDAWRAIVRLAGVTESRSFSRKSEAQKWATGREAEIRAGTVGAVPDKTFGDLLHKYLEEVTPTKEGARWEAIRINAFIRDPIANRRLSVLDRHDFISWRDRRIKAVSSGTVRREWTVLSGVCTKAIEEWRWLHKHPMKNIKLPEAPPDRDRRISQDEIDRICHCLGYSDDVPLDTVSSRVGAAFMFAIETAMRAGEILALTKEDLFLESRFLKVRGLTKGGRKTRSAKRDVPLTQKAVEILKRLPGDSLFDVRSASLDTIFRRARDAAMVDNLHFHDTRHEGITRLAEKLDILELARAIGHKDLKMLMVYYNKSAADIAKNL